MTLFNISGYTIHEKIGEGGSAEVWLATRENDGQRAALKVLNTRYSGDRAMRKRLSREAEVIGKLCDPNIVKIYKWGTLENNRFYMLLEYLAQGSLSDFAGMTPRQRLKVMIQVCSGVARIHESHIIHRDLKPSNIMFGDDRIPRIVDFGISLFSQEEYTRLTHTNMVMGTLSYMSPEQQTNPGEVDARSDIYALGAILYEIFTNRKPVGRFADPTTLIPNFDKQFEACILRCLAHRPEDRYPSARELQQALIGLWRDGLFENGETEQENNFDDRIGYWVQKLVHGTSGQRLEAKQRILLNTLPEDHDKLIKICLNSEAEVRAALIPCLGKLRNRRSVPFLCRQLGNPMLTREACTALQAIGDERALDPLVKVLKKQEVYSYHALVAVAQLGGEKHLKAMLPYLKSKSFSERQEAIKAMEEIATKKALRELRKSHKNETDRELRNRLYHLIQRLELA